jgi:hypothetical protein
MSLDDWLSALEEAEKLRDAGRDRLDALLNVLDADLGRRDDLLSWIFVQRFMLAQDNELEYTRDLLVMALCRLIAHKRVQDSWGEGQEMGPGKGRR